MLRTLAKVFFEFATITLLFAKVSRKLDVIIIIVYIYIVFKAPGVRQEKGTGEFRFGSGSVPCVVLLDNHVALHTKVLRKSKCILKGWPNTPYKKKLVTNSLS